MQAEPLYSIHARDHAPAAERAHRLSARERALALSVADAALPAGRFIPAVGPDALDRVEDFLSSTGMLGAYRGLLFGLDALARTRHARSFARLSSERRLALLEWLAHGDYARRWFARGLIAPLKAAHYGSDAIYRSLGCVWDFHAPDRDERPRWVIERTLSGRDLAADESLECDVVVVGTGAGGAVVARELAEMGCAVVLLEEGDYFTRRDFTGRTFEMHRLLYRNPAETTTVGNVAIPVLAGRTVGGTTTVNAGTCYRAPRRVLRTWRDELGLRDLTEEALAEYYERVEGVLGVAPGRAEVLGGVARVIARGCDALGYRHAPLRRNAPECDGKGICTFGCPTDAKRSTNVSYVPLALRAGAQLLCAVKVEEVLLEHGRAVGVRGRARGTGHTVTVRARAVVLSCGTLFTPALLLRQGLANSSGEVGKNLSIHPAMAAAGVFDERIDATNAVPQGYSIEEFHDEGLLFEGATPPLDLGAAALLTLGPRFTEMMESFDHTAFFGFAIEDTSRGRLRLVGPGRKAGKARPLLTYWLNDHDVARLKRGLSILTRVFFAAGARRVLTTIPGFEEIDSVADAARIDRADLKARDYDLTAYHPLGTARMGADARASVVGPTNECHDVPNLFVIDGSAVPTSLGVNPQLTIMVLATRAAPFVARAAERVRA